MTSWTQTQILLPHLGRKFGGIQPIVFKQDDFAFILADTSAPRNAGTYLAADLNGKQLEHSSAAEFRLLTHSPTQGKVDGWPHMECTNLMK